MVRNEYLFIDSMNQLPTSATDIWSKFYNTMFNTGNLVFNECCKKELKYDDVYKLGRQWGDVSRNQVYVLPLSNNLSVEDTYFTRMLYRVAKYNLNIVPVGLGVQANIDESPKEFVKKIPGRKKRLFQQLAANTTTIGVRGRLRQNVCNSLEFKMFVSSAALRFIVILY